MAQPIATAGFNFVTQLSEGFLNRLLKALYQTRAFPIEFENSLRHEDAEYGLEFLLHYLMKLDEPSLYFDTGVTGGVGLKGSLDGELLFESTILPRPDEGEYKYRLPIQFHADYDIVAELTFRTRDEQLFLVVKFEDIRDFDLILSPASIPPLHSELISRLIKRALLVNARRKIKWIPISQAFEKTRLVGLPLAEPVLRIIDGPSPPDFDNATVAMSTRRDQVFGRPNLLYDFVNPERDFAIGLDQNLILFALERAWRQETIPRRYNDQGRVDPRGKNRLRGITFDLQDEEITFSVLAARDGIADFGVHGSVRIIVENGYIHTDFSRPDIEWPGWVDILGFLSMSIAWIVVRKVCEFVLGGLIEEAAETGLEEFLETNHIRFAFSGDVPGTTLSLTATARELHIRPNEITSCGSVEIEISNGA